MKPLRSPSTAANPELAEPNGFPDGPHSDPTSRIATLPTSPTFAATIDARSAACANASAPRATRCRRRGGKSQHVETVIQIWSQVEGVEHRGHHVVFAVRATLPPSRRRIGGIEERPATGVVAGPQARS